MSILEKIVEKKREEVDQLKRAGIIPPPAEPRPVRGFQDALTTSRDVAIIAEAKKASPSKGLLCPDFDPVAIARDYEEAGAKAVSVLTDRKFFQGSLEYLDRIRSNVSLPVLRKDFIIDHLQVQEASIWGADAILLIAAILDQSLMEELLDHARGLNMDVLVEVHHEKEAERALEAGAGLIGVNNRDLRDFTVSLDTTLRLRRLIPEEIPVVSESGIRTGEDIKLLSQNNISAVLIGESLVTARDRKEKLGEFLKGSQRTGQ